MGGQVRVEAATEATDELALALARLVPQLSRSSPPPTREELAEIVTSPSTTLFVARDGEGDEILGTLTLVLFRIPTAKRALIEDVVVDEAARRRGVAEALTRAALDLAAEEGVRTVDLTSRPSREAANRLYRRLGFEVRDTNVYRYTAAADGS